MKKQNSSKHTAISHAKLKEGNDTTEVATCYELRKGKHMIRDRRQMTLVSKLYNVRCICGTELTIKVMDINKIPKFLPYESTDRNPQMKSSFNEPDCL
jgi:hypothetical protein